MSYLDKFQSSGSGRNQFNLAIVGGNSLRILVPWQA